MSEKKRKLRTLKDGRKVPVLTKTELIENLETVIDLLKQDKFQGVVTSSHGKVNFVYAVGGKARDRINIIDNVFLSIYTEVFEDVRQHMMKEMYKRWKHYYGKMAIKEFMAEMRRHKGVPQR